MPRPDRSGQTRLGLITTFWPGLMGSPPAIDTALRTAASMSCSIRTTATVVFSAVAITVTSVSVAFC